MELKAFEGVSKDELSMIEVAHAILEQHGDVMDFSDLVNQIQNYLGKADSEIRDILSQFYTDLNIDGSFISLGDNRWGLRSWYPIDSIDEEISQGLDDEDEEMPHRRKRKKVNAFLDLEGEDIIDYTDDDPEDDADLVEVDSDGDELYLEDEEDEEPEEIKAYDSELSEIGANDDLGDDEEIIPEGVEDDLTIIDDDEEDEEDEDDYSEE